MPHWASFSSVPTCCATLTGFKFATTGHDTRPIQAYLGHRSIMSTIRYTVLDGEPVQELLERLGGAAQSEAKTASPP